MRHGACLSCETGKLSFFMWNLAIAFARGLWNRLIGYLASGGASVSRVIAIADSAPTNVLLTRSEATTAINWGKSAINAAENWIKGEAVDRIIIPKVPGPELPNLDGGDQGKFGASVLIVDPQGTNPTVPLQFSANRLPSVTELVERIDEFKESESGKKYKRYLDWLSDALLYNPKKALVHHWLMEYLYP